MSRRAYRPHPAPAAGRRVTAVLGGVVLGGTASAAVVASAYVTAAGVGSGTGGTGTLSSVDLAPGTLTASLYPGGTATVTTKATNPNPGPVRLTSLALDTSRGTSGFAVDASHSACTLSTFSFTTQTNGSAGWTVPGSGTLTITLPAAVAASDTTANACQGATLTVYLKAGG